MLEAFANLYPNPGVISSCKLLPGSSHQWPGQQKFPTLLQFQALGLQQRVKRERRSEGRRLNFRNLIARLLNIEGSPFSAWRSTLLRKAAHTVVFAYKTLSKSSAAWVAEQDALSTVPGITNHPWTWRAAVWVLCLIFPLVLSFISRRVELTLPFQWLHSSKLTLIVSVSENDF